MSWIHYFVGVSHFAECRKNRPVTVSEMLINLKFPVPQRLGQWKSYPESASETGSPPKVTSFFQLVGPIITPSFSEIGSLLFEVILITVRQTNDSTTDMQTDPIA